jgi:hypothetical protein
MRELRSLIGVAIILAVSAFGSPILRLTNDLALRLMLVPVLLAVLGGALRAHLVQRISKLIGARDSGFGLPARSDQSVCATARLSHRPGRRKESQR